VRRIQQLSFLDLERSTYGYADGNNRSALPIRGVHQLLEPVYNLGEDPGEWFMRSREPFDSLDDPAIERAFDARRLRAADVETDNATQSNFPNRAAGELWGRVHWSSGSDQFALAAVDVSQNTGTWVSLLLGENLSTCTVYL
jgi:hypothetical protein